MTTTPDDSVQLDQPVHKTIAINATPAQVWEALTNPALMKQWMSDTEIDIDTTWEVGSPIAIGGAWYKTRFENKGVVLQCEPEQVLQYSHLSSLSRLPDKPESYSAVEFRLRLEGQQTLLSLTLIGFPTEAIYKHLVFYWNTTLELLKKFIER